jgi:hypothetical protein
MVSMYILTGRILRLMLRMKYRAKSAKSMMSHLNHIEKLKLGFLKLIGADVD